MSDNLLVVSGSLHFLIINEPLTTNNRRLLWIFLRVWLAKVCGWF